MNKPWLRNAAFVLNILLIVLIARFVDAYGFSDFSDEDGFLDLLSFSAPICSLVWMHFNGGLPLRASDWNIGDAEERRMRSELRMAEMKKKLEEMQK